KCPASFEAGHFYFADKSGSLNSLAVVPLPLPDLRQVHAVILDILAVLHQLVVHPLDQIGPPVTQGVQPLDHVDHQMEPVDIIEDPHVEGRGDGALLLVATDVKMLVVPAVGQLMNQRGVS
ncbi:Translation initiation factor 2, partial [Dysosmobacter welbionis]